MPTLDLTEVLEAEEFQDTIVVYATFGVINAHGVAAETTDSGITTNAIVIPGQSNLRRADDGARVDAYIEVYTKYPLSAGYKSDDAHYRDADEIRWHGRRFSVMKVEDYSGFGSGFIKASCDLLDFNPTA